MEYLEIIGYSTSLLLGIAVLIGHEAVKRTINNLFNDLSKSQLNLIFVFVVILSLVLPSGAGNLFAPPNQNAEEPVKEPVLPPVDPYAEAAEALLEVTSDAIEIKQKRDSVRRAEKGHMWAYQIGVARKEDAAWQLLNNLKTLEGISLFKEDRRTYYVIYYDGSSREDMEGTLELFQKKIQNVNEEIKLVDLIDKCSRKKIVKADTERNKSLDLTRTCYICD